MSDGTDKQLKWRLEMGDSKKETVETQAAGRCYGELVG
jgi:hypothetical protein